MVTKGQVWLLNLDQIESGTGRVVNKDFIAADELGTSTHAFERGTVLYSKLRPYLNKVVVADEPGYATTELVPLRCNEELVMPEYLAYFLRAPQFLSFASAVVAGAKMPRMVMSEFWSYEVPLPSLPEQRRIVAILSQADVLRAKRQEAWAQLGSLADSIFIELFGDPVFSPKDCTPATLGEAVAQMQYGPRFYNEVYSPTGVRIVRITDLDASGALNFDTMPMMNVDDSVRAQFELHPGDIVFARTGATVGKVALIDAASPPCIAGAYFIRMRLKEGVLPEFAFHALRTKSVQSLITAQSRQAAQQNFSGPGLRRLPLPLPPLERQREFAHRLATVQREKMLHQRSLDDFDAMFESLQHRAFSNEV
jgi:type I restriction enzyme, S subunit